MNKLEELKALINAATKGPWQETYGAQRDEVCSFVIRGAKGNEPRHHYIHGENGKNGTTNSDADAALIVAMRNLLPQLIAVAEASQNAHKRWESKDWKEITVQRHGWVIKCTYDMPMEFLVYYKSGFYLTKKDAEKNIIHKHREKAVKVTVPCDEI